MGIVAKTTAVITANKKKTDSKLVRKMVEIVFMAVTMGIGVVLAVPYVKLAVRLQYVTQQQEHV